MVVPVYAVEVDWNNDGAFGAGSENVSADVRELAWNRGRSETKGEVVTGAAEFTVNNNGGKYSPDNSGSPLFGLMKPFRPLRITATFSGSSFALFKGFVQRYTPDPAKDRRLTYVYAEDLFKKLRFRKTSTGVLVDKKFHEVAATILDDIGVGAAQRSLDTTYDSAPFAWYDQRDAINALAQVVEAGQYTHFIAPDGKYTLRNRYFDIGGTVYKTYSATMVGLRVEHSEQEIQNRIDVKATPRKISTSIEEVWRLQETLSLNPGEQRTIFAEFTDPQLPQALRTPASGMVVPVATTDYTANASLDGSGVDKTAQLGVSSTFFAETAKLVLTNNDAAAIHVTLFRLRGKPMRAQPPIFARSEDSASQSAYELRHQVFENDLIGQQLVAQDLSAYLLVRYKDVRPRVTMTLRNLFPDLLEIELGTVVQITEPNTGISGKWSVTGMAHRVSDGGLRHECEYQLQQWIDYGFFILDVSQLDIGKLAY